MQHITMPQTGSCLLYSAAMVLDLDPVALVDLIGHDGSEIWFPEIKGLPLYARTRGFHVQEIVDAALEINTALVEITPDPLCCPVADSELARHVFLPQEGFDRFKRWLSGRRAILYGAFDDHPLYHAVALGEDGICFDPRGFVLDLNALSPRFIIEAAYVNFNII